MKHEITLDGAIDFAPESEEMEILQNVRTILTTRLGSVPLYRDFGLTWQYIDEPYPVAKSLIHAAIIDAIEEFEPRARVVSVSFDESTDDAMEGILKPRVIVGIGEEEEEDDI